MADSKEKKVTDVAKICMDTKDQFLTAYKYACESAQRYDPRNRWELLGDKAMFYELYVEAVRCYTQALRFITVTQCKKFKRPSANQVFMGKPYADVRYKLAKAFLKAKMPGCAMDEISFAEQYVGDEYFMCEVLAALKYWQKLKIRRDALLNRAGKSGRSEVEIHLNWIHSQALAEKLELQKKYEGYEFHVNIANIRDPEAVFNFLELQPVSFFLPGPVSQLPLRFPDDFKELFVRVNRQHPTISLGPSPIHRIGMFAERDFKAGEIIVSEEATLCVPLRGNRCSTCLKAVPVKERRICVKCNGASGEIYCSAECVSKADATYHTKLCGAPLKNLYALSAKPEYGDFGFIQVMVMKAFGYTIQNADWPRTCVFDMPEFKYLHVHSGHEVDYQKFFGMYMWISRWAATFGYPNFNMDVYQSVFLLMMTNCLKFTEDDIPQGLVLGDATCYLNHKCDPNAERRVLGNQIHISAAQDIKQGEEITVSYIPPSPLPGRAEMLHQFGITCSCDMCSVPDKKPTSKAAKHGSMVGGFLNRATKKN